MNDLMPNLIRILFIESLIDERLFENPILYINCDELPNFEFSSEENEALRRYMELGGFVYLDAGIKASFLGPTSAIATQPGKSAMKSVPGSLNSWTINLCPFTQKSRNFPHFLQGASG